MKRKTIIAIIIITVFSITLIAYFYSFKQPSKIERPEYCDSNGCIPKEVFKNLPDYPEDIEGVKYSIVIPLMNVTRKHPNEYYYKQPEFYTDSFATKGVGYYTILSKPYNFTYINVAGYGAYPAELKVNVKEGEYNLTTYLHASWGVVKYQGIGLEVNYPEKSEDCFSVSLSPRAVLLGRTYFIFDSNWAEKIEIKLKVNEACPKGQYLIAISASKVPEGIEDNLIRIYGSGYMPLGMVKIDPLIKLYITKN